MTRNLTSLFFFFILISPCYSQTDVTGKWKTVDDNSGAVKSIVEVYLKGNLIYGKITEIFREADEDKDPVCTKCPEDDPRYNSKIIGMEIMKEMKKNNDVYAGGTILDPESGNIYRCKIWLEGKNLMVRGYWGPFYRTQTWIPVN